MHKKYEPEKIIVFGSYVHGEVDEYSDLDFVVIKETSKRFLERLIDVAKLIDDELGQVDVFVYTPEEFQRMIEWKNPFIESVLKEGRVVYEKNKVEALRWLKQAEYNLDVAENNLKGSFY